MDRQDCRNGTFSDSATSRAQNTSSAAEIKTTECYRLPAGSSSKITEQNLKATDIDSDSLKIRYMLTKDPPTGKLQLSKNKRVEKISVKGPVQSFTQDDVNKGASLSFPTAEIF